MGVTNEYFAAADDTAAARVLGAGLPVVLGPLDDGFVLGGPVLGPDPVVELTTLEALLRGLPDEAAIALIDRPDCGRVVAGDPGEQAVLAVADGTVAALLDADDGALERAAGPWSQAEEFWGQAEPEVLLAVATALRELCRRAESTARVYCLTTL